MTSTLTLYKNCKIIPEKNFKVDNIVSYLANVDKEVITNFQYVKQDLSMKIKIDKSQNNLDMISNYNVNYCSLQNLGGKKIYYFIIGKKWLSASCIELSLSMDTINSFLDDVVLSDRTRILRQHKNRFQGREDKEIIEETYTSFNDLETGKEYSLKRTLLTDSDVNYNVSIDYPNYFTIRRRSRGTFEDLFEVNATFFQVKKNTSGEISIMLTDYEGEFVYLDYNLLETITIEFNTLASITYRTIWKAFEGYYSHNFKLLPKIDFYSEGLHPILYQTKTIDVLDKYANSSDPEENSFYLIYKTRTTDENAPVDTYLCSDVEMKVGSTSKRNGTLNGDVQKWIVFPYTSDNAGATISYKKKGQFTASVIVLDTPQSFLLLSGLPSISGGNVFHVAKYFMRNNALVEEWNDTLENGEILYTDIDEIRIGARRSFMFANYTEALAFGNNYFDEEETPETTISSISSLDKTNSQLVKVIKLPYCPTPLSKVNDVYLFDEATWEVGSEVGFSFLKLKDGNAKFEKVLNYDGDTPYSLANTQLITTRERIAKNIANETKLLHSDYYLPKFVYDSFSFEYHLEEFSSIVPTYMNIKFVATTTINSRFMFVMNEYQTLGRAREDYFNILPIARNNELVLFNSSYLNYIRTGYNYDVKTKQRNEAVQIASAIGKTIGSIASFVVNPALGVAISVSTAMSYISTANTIAQSEQNIEQKVAQSKMQAVSVAGSDDVDLMTYYTNNNKASLKFYEVSPKLKKALFDLFYYTGYISDEYGVPNTNTRLNFNFVSAEVVFATTPNLSQDIIEDLRNKYGMGITFLHKWENAWDFEQIYENWESNI